jgi:cytidylate kinase
MIVAIDGPSGVGKSTVARLVADELGVPYLSTGQMYRAVALKVLETRIDPGDRAAVEQLARSVDLRLEVSGNRLVVLLDGAGPGRRAYDLDVSTVTSRISAYPGVRSRLVELQRRAAREHGGVLEGRDIGTRVFPTAAHKFFLDAAPGVRAERRWRQLSEAGKGGTDRREVLREVRSRDERDSTRADSPLTRDSSYRFIATDDLSAEEVAELVVREIRAAGG